jgi:hypothetical protein
MRITAGPFPAGPLLAEQPALIVGFTAGPAYDPAVNTMSTFAAVSSAEPAVKGFSPLVARSMSNAWRNPQR